VVLGGYFATTPPGNCAFCFSNFTDTNNLTIETAAPTPEPSLTVVGTVLFAGMGLVALRRRKSAARTKS
jgi:LPXTG-motif cell wall-anchored protein